MIGIFCICGVAGLRGGGGGGFILEVDNENNISESTNECVKTVVLKAGPLIISILNIFYKNHKISLAPRDS